ncbi:MAG: MBL fold metallo-hydrolase [Ruminococcus sp.]|nr:MBL fold metallo-hydrolase [Ruminococcus sp.]
MKITVLIENSSDCELAKEHGLSLLIETSDKKILLDAGCSELFANNADKLNIDLSDVDFAVLSHGHYDHSGGFDVFFERNKNAVLYARAGADGKYYSPNGGIHEIGVPQKVLDYTDRIEYVSDNRQISEGVYLVGHNTPDLQKIGEKVKLYKGENGEIVPDDFSHEQSLIFDTPKGLIIFNSCSHGTVANIIRETKEFFGNKPIYAYVGGLHMLGKTPDGKEICSFTDFEVDELCDLIKKEKITYLCTGHCTTLDGYDKVKERLGETAVKLITGLQFEL